MSGLLQKLRNYTLEKRKAHLFSFLASFERPTRIVDLGGTALFWKRMGITESDQLDITLVNNHHIDVTQAGYDHSIQFIREECRDVLTLSADILSGYDLIFSNSMIEHLSSIEKQQQLCDIIERSGLPYFIQVPNKNSLIDPHFPHPCVPFFAAYPKWLQIRLLTLHRFGSGERSPDRTHAEKRMLFYNPLDAHTFRTLLPSGTLTKEHHLGIPMSFIMSRNIKA